MPLPKIIFCETHSDPISGTILLKIAPKLKQLGYEVFYAEAPKDSTLEQAMQGFELTALASQQAVLQLNFLQQQFPSIKLPSNVMDPITDGLERARAEATFNEFYKYLKTSDLHYKAIDIAGSGDDLELVKYAVSAEGINARDKRFTEFYVNEKKPVFGVIGFKHAIGMQKEILKKLPHDEASTQFHFINVYQKAPIDADEIAMRSGELKYPLGMSLFDANSMTEDQIVDSILQQIVIKSSSKRMPSQIAVDNVSNGARFYSSTTREQKSNEWDFDKPTAGMLILAAFVPILGWGYLLYVLYNAICDWLEADNQQKPAMDVKF